MVALADPTNEVLNRNIREALGQDARFVVAARSELNEVITEAYSGASSQRRAPLTVDTSIPPQAEPEPEPRSSPGRPSVEPRAEEARPEPSRRHPAPETEPRRPSRARAELEPEPEPA